MSEKDDRAIIDHAVNGIAELIAKDNPEFGKQKLMCCGKEARLVKTTDEPTHTFTIYMCQECMTTICVQAIPFAKMHEYMKIGDKIKSP